MNSCKKIKNTNKIWGLAFSIILSGNSILHSAAIIQPDEVTLNIDLKLIQAVETGKTDQVEKLIISGANVNAVGPEGNTALIVAARNGYRDITKLLIEKRADPNVFGNFGDTVLMEAVRRGYRSIVQLLVDSGVDINIANADGHTALIFAFKCFKDFIDIVKLLINGGTDIDKTDKHGRKAIDIANELHPWNIQGVETKSTIISLLHIEPARRGAAKQWRNAITKQLLQIELLPSALISLIDNYIPSDLAGLLSDYAEAEKLKR